MSLRLAPRLRLTRTWMPSPAHPRRALAVSAPRRDIMAELDKQLHPRELVERKRKEMEEKYGDKLKRRAEAEGVQDLEALKKKVEVPSIKETLRAKMHAEEYRKEKERAAAAATASQEYSQAVDRGATTPGSAAGKKETISQDDPSGIKPLGSIINLPLLHLTPHTSEQISQIWTTYHVAHPSLSSSYLSASLPAATYESMLSLARANPFFVLPLPREADSATGGADGAVQTDTYEMFYLQWIFHAAPTASAPPLTGTESSPAPLPRGSSAILTPLEEFKKNGEWAQPQLVLTHYPDLAQSHDLVLMRGEISAASAGGPPGSAANPGWMLSQQQAQLLALALQRFYCADVVPAAETPAAARERQERKEALVAMRERPEEWDWSKLVGMAYGGML